MSSKIPTVDYTSHFNINISLVSREQSLTTVQKVLRKMDNYGFLQGPQRIQLSKHFPLIQKFISHTLAVKKFTLLYKESNGLLNNILLEASYFFHNTNHINLHHAEELFLRRYEILRQSNYLHFMEPPGSLPHSHEPTTCPHPQPDRSSPSPSPSHFVMIHFNIIVPSVS